MKLRKICRIFSNVKRIGRQGASHNVRLIQLSVSINESNVFIVSSYLGIYVYEFLTFFILSLDVNIGIYMYIAVVGTFIEINQWRMGFYSRIKIGIDSFIEVFSRYDFLFVYLMAFRLNNTTSYGPISYAPYDMDGP